MNSILSLFAVALLLVGFDRNRETPVTPETVLFRGDWTNGNRAKVTADLVALLKEGMTKDQVTSLLERPFRLSDGIAQDGNSEKWTFTISLGRILILTFEGDKLITIDGG